MLPSSITCGSLPLRALWFQKKHLHCDASHKWICIQRVQMKVSSWHSSWHFTLCLDGSVWSGCRKIPWLARIVFFSWPFYVVSLSHRGGTVCLLKLIAVRGHDKWNCEFRQRSHQFCRCSQQWSFGTCCPTASWPSWAWFFCGTETAIANLNS